MSDHTADKMQSEHQEPTQGSLEDRMADPMDLVYKGGYAGNPREIVENPAVAPQMTTIGQADGDNLRDDMIPYEVQGENADSE